MKEIDLSYNLSYFNDNGISGNRLWSFHINGTLIEARSLDFTNVVEVSFVFEGSYSFKVGRVIVLETGM